MTRYSSSVSLAGKIQQNKSAQVNVKVLVNCTAPSQVTSLCDDCFARGTSFSEGKPIQQQQVCCYCFVLRALGYWYKEGILPAFSRISAVDSCPAATARSPAQLPCLSMAFQGVPAASNNVTALSCPLAAASISALRPFSSCKEVRMSEHTLCNAPLSATASTWATSSGRYACMQGEMQYCQCA